MAEALGLASSIIAVADLAGKTISLTIKLKALWEEVKDVPVTLLDKAEHLQNLEELLDLAEEDAAEDYMPIAVLNAINRARAAKNDVQSTIDAYTEELANKRRYRRRIAAAKFVIQKDDLRTVEQKLDRALELYKLANNVVYGRYNRLIYKQLAESASTMFISTSSQGPTIDPGDSAGFTSSQIVTFKAAKPTKKAIFEGPSILGRLCFGYYDKTCSFSMRIPDWLGGKVYSAMFQRSIAGWQSLLSVYPVIHHFENELVHIVWDDDVNALQKYICENNLTPLAHNSFGENLLHFALANESVETAKWLLSSGLSPGSFSECQASWYDKNTICPIEDYVVYFDSTRRSRQAEILQLCQAHMPDPVEYSDKIWGLMISGKSFEDFKTLQMLIEPRYIAFSPWERYLHASGGVSFSNWSWHEVKELLPEAEPLTAEFIAICRSKSYFHGLSAVVAEALGRDLVKLHRKESWLPVNCSFYPVLGDVARLDLEDITYVPGNTHLNMGGVTPLSFFLSRLLWELNELNPPEEVFDEMLQSSIILWANALYSGGVDLLHYGRKVRDIYRDVGWRVSEKTIRRLDSEGYTTGISYTCSLLGITYGSLPTQWRLWWAPNINDYAADFWNLVEDSDANSCGFNVPGGWADDFDDERDDGHEAKASFIWSEYRNIRPPT